MKTTFKATMFGTALLAATMATIGFSTSAHSMTLNLKDSKPHISDTASELPVELVGSRGHRYGGYRHGGGGRYYGYNPGRHGPRYGYRYGNYRHYYGGYWYAFPWWLGTAAVAAPYYADPYYYDAEPVYSGGDHVQWCLNRYRSYNPRTDTFRGYDGLDHRCVSPYSY